MFDRLLSFVGACALILAVTAMVPVFPAYAAGSNCDGGCNATCQNDTNESTCDNDDDCACKLTSTSCTCDDG